MLEKGPPFFFVSVDTLRCGGEGAHGAPPAIWWQERSRARTDARAHGERAHPRMRTTTTTATTTSKGIHVAKSVLVVWWFSSSRSHSNHG